MGRPREFDETTAIDSAVVMFYGMGVLKGKSATVTVAYKGF